MAVILLVDDNDDNRAIYCMILSHRGHTCHEAEDGQIGVTLAQELAPDLILMDISMPVMDGFEAILRLRSSAVTSAIPVVARASRSRIRKVIRKNALDTTVQIGRTSLGRVAPAVLHARARSEEETPRRDGLVSRLLSYFPCVSLLVS